MILHPLAPPRRARFALALAGLVAVAVTTASPRALRAQRRGGRASGAPTTADSIRDDQAFSFYDRGPFRPGVPRPDSLLGYEAGHWNTQYAAQERTLLAIAAAAPERVRVEPLAVTREHRHMRLYVVSDPSNIQHLDEIRAALDTLADPRLLGPGAARDALAARTPAVVWVSGSVHGNEPGGFEASMWLLYQLAASADSATVAALRHVIVVINPSSNPDGHERFAVWYNSEGVDAPDAVAAEHNEPWSIQGRFNHYRFDMNRDVIASTQPEVQGIVRGMLRWHPMVAMDLHGQVASYFFPPAARPVNAMLGRDPGKWLDIIGRGNAAGFDRYGWMYFSRDVFDLYYPGYWDTWPSLTGATGMTYETDGGGWKGLLWRRDDGSLLSFRDGIAKHYVAALSTILTTGARSAERVRDWAAFRAAAVSDGESGAMRRVVLVPGADPGRAAGLVSSLLRAGIEVRRTTAPLTLARAHAYLPDSGGAPSAGPRQIPAGAYVIDLAQPQGRVAHSIMDPAPELDSVFARTQIEKYRRNETRGRDAPRESYEFYDITAWALPITFGVESYWSDDVSPVRGDRVTLPAVGADSLDVELPVDGHVTGAPATSAYLFAPDRDGAAAMAFHLMDEGVRVAVATQPIEAGGTRWPRGSWVVRVGRNDSTVHARVAALASRYGVDVSGTNTAYTTEAQYGVGSEPTIAVTTPRIAVVGGEGVSQTAYGSVWWTLDHRYGIHFLPLTTESLRAGALGLVNVIVIPDAEPDALAARIGKDGADRLRSWVRGGGSLVLMGGAAEWGAREDVGLTSARKVGGDSSAASASGAAGASPKGADAKGADAKGADAKGGDAKGADSKASDSAAIRAALAPLAGIRSPSARTDVPEPVPGSDFDVVIDRTSWLTYGIDRPRLSVLMQGDTFLKPSKDGVNVAVFPTTGPITRGGFVWPDNTERLLRGTAFLIDEPTGRGHVILFADDPTFRGWWRALDRLVTNAILLGPTF